MMGVVEGGSFYRRLVCPSGHGERQKYIGQGFTQGLPEGGDFILEEEGEQGKDAVGFYID
jgi:hypothetical protein